jgi:hypothetical protein
MLLVVDPRHWLTEDGAFVHEPRHLYRQMLRIAQFIEAGGPLPKDTTRETLIPCKRKPKGRACLGLMWVLKTPKDEIFAQCMVCKSDEALIHDWQGTEWAEGPMDPSPLDFDAAPLN